MDGDSGFLKTTMYIFFKIDFHTVFEIIALALFASGSYLLYSLMVKENGGIAFKLLFSEKRKKGSVKNIVIWLLVWLSLLAYIFMVHNQYIFFASIVSDSMNPDLEAGDVILMQKIDKTLKVDDIAAFNGREQGIPIIHRIYRIDGNKIITKGDSNPLPDAPIEAKEVLAKAILVFGKPVVLDSAGYPIELGEWKPPASMRIAAFTAARYQEHLPYLLGLATAAYILVLLTGRKAEHLKRSGEHE